MFPGTLPQTDQLVRLGVITESILVRLGWRETMIHRWDNIGVPYLQVDQIEEDGRPSAIPIAIGVLEYPAMNQVVVFLRLPRGCLVFSKQMIPISDMIARGYRFERHIGIISLHGRQLPAILKLSSLKVVSSMVELLKRIYGEPQTITLTAEQLTELLKITPRLVSMTDE